MAILRAFAIDDKEMAAGRALAHHLHGLVRLEPIEHTFDPRGLNAPRDRDRFSAYEVRATTPRFASNSGTGSHSIE